jgi:ABC-type nitrate/sulfonate/bicarbonate transport system substrate-binding protein
MTKKLLPVCGWSVLLFAVALGPARAAQAPTKVTMTTGSFSEREAAMFVAMDQGFFRRAFLRVSIPSLSEV